MREPLYEPADPGRLGEATVEIVLRAERPVVAKQLVAKERVSLEKDVVRTVETVTDELRQERVDVVGDVQPRLTVGGDVALGGDPLDLHVRRDLGALDDHVPLDADPLARDGALLDRRLLPVHRDLDRLGLPGRAADGPAEQLARHLDRLDLDLDRHGDGARVDEFVQPQPSGLDGLGAAEATSSWRTSAVTRPNRPSRSLSTGGIGPTGSGGTASSRSLGQAERIPSAATSAPATGAISGRSGRAIRSHVSSCVSAAR